jgi:hypothetical protein
MDEPEKESTFLTKKKRQDREKLVWRTLGFCFFSGDGKRSSKRGW